MMMPLMGGQEMIRQIRSHDELAEIPIIILSAKADDDLMVKVLQNGAQDYVVKPFSAPELLTRARNLVRLKRSKDEINTINANLKSAYKDLESFAYSVSHDLRAPLRSIDGFSQALEDDFGSLLDENGKDHLRRIKSGVGLMANLIDGLLGLSRVSRTEMNRMPVSLSAIVATLSNELKAADPDRVVEFRIAENITVNGDPTLLRVTLSNLMA